MGCHDQELAQLAEICVGGKDVCQFLCDNKN